MCELLCTNIFVGCGNPEKLNAQTGYCRQIFVLLIFVVHQPHKNILTTNISQLRYTSKYSHNYCTVHNYRAVQSLYCASTCIVHETRSLQFTYCEASKWYWPALTAKILCIGTMLAMSWYQEAIHRPRVSTVVVVVAMYGECWLGWLPRCATTCTCTSVQYMCNRHIF